MTPDALARALEPFVRAEGLWRDEYAGNRRGWFLSLVALFQPRLKRLMTFADDARPLLSGQLSMNETAARKHLFKTELKAPLSALRTAFADGVSFDKDLLESALRTVAEKAEVKPAALIHATRVAVTGQAVSPGLFEVLELLGRDEVLRRLDTALSALSTL
jgi:glutamyl/glutaminyl-tRNA synthetase